MTTVHINLRMIHACKVIKVHFDNNLNANTRSVWNFVHRKRYYASHANMFDVNFEMVGIHYNHAPVIYAN